MPMHIAVLTLELYLPGCHSLKQKRSRLKPLLARLHQQFNISASEIDHLDHHTTSVVACAIVSNSAQHGQRLLNRIPGWIETHRPDLQITYHSITLV
jgi:uncharacterized protein YlxP (DUF503 family)